MLVTIEEVLKSVDHIATKGVIGLFRVLRKGSVGILDGDNKFSVGRVNP